MISPPLAGAPLTRDDRRPVFGLVFLLSLAALLANGRAIGSGDSRVSELTAASLARRGSFVLRDIPENDPFTRPVAQPENAPGAISIYSPATAMVAAPFFFVASLFVDLDEGGRAFAGKVVASVLAALAGAFMTLTPRWLRAGRLARTISGLLFVLATGLGATSQALWQHPLTVVSLAIALGGLGGPRKTARSVLFGGFVGLAAAARPAAIPMCALLGLGALVTRSVRPGLAVAGALVPALGIGAYNAVFLGAPWRFGVENATSRFGGAFPDSIVGLLFSPGRGLLVYTPLALVTIVVAVRAVLGATTTPRLEQGGIRSGDARPLGPWIGAAAFVHLFFVSLWNEWHGGESFGPRLLTDALPLVFFDLPAGLTLFPRLSAVFALWSLGAQMVGAWMYDYRWERLHQRGASFDRALWSWADSPLVFHLRERVVIRGVPTLVDSRRLRFPARRYVLFGGSGSAVRFDNGAIVLEGSPLVTHARLERGARPGSAPSRVSLSHPQDGIAWRIERRRIDALGVGDGAAARIRVAARGAGRLTLVCSGQVLESPLAETEGVIEFFPCPLPWDDDVLLRTPDGPAEILRIDVSLEPATPRLSGAASGAGAAASRFPSEASCAAARSSRDAPT